MELDDLKNIWNREAEKLSSSHHADQAALTAMLHNKSKDIISRLKKNLLFEYYFTMVSWVAGMVAFPLVPIPEIRIALVTLFVICLVFIFYYRIQIKLIKSLGPQGRNLRTELKFLLERFNQYLRFYRITYRVLIPFSMLLGLNLGGQLTKDNNWEKIISSPIVLVSILIFLVGISYVIDRLLRWYLYRLYNRHLNHLNDVLTELEE